jgi:hypothetical protein
MPRHDPITGAGESLCRRFWRIFRLLVVLSIVIAAMAVLLVARGDPTLHIHMLVATALGIGFTVLLGTALMTLLFLSSSSGHDDEVAGNIHQENERE